MNLLESFQQGLPEGEVRRAPVPGEHYLGDDSAEPTGEVSNKNVLLESFKQGLPLNTRADAQLEWSDSANLKAHPYAGKVSQYAEQEMPGDARFAGLAQRVLRAESPASNPMKRSEKDARGPMQVLPDTFAEALPQGDIDNPNDLTLAGVKHLARLYRKYNGDLTLSSAAYNAGEGRVKRYGGVPPFAETRGYVAQTAHDFTGKASTLLDSFRQGLPASAKPAPATQPEAQPEQAQGLVKPGNIDLHNRPVVRNDDGSISTVRSITVTLDDGKAMLIPTVVNGKVVSNEEAVAYAKKTGQHLGVFSSVQAADDYAQKLHEDQAAEYLPKSNGPSAARSTAAYPGDEMSRARNQAEIKEVLGRHLTPAGVGEVMLSGLSNVFASVPAAASGLVEAIRNKDPQAFAEAFKLVQEHWTYEPRTKYGQYLNEHLQQAMSVLGKIGDFLAEGIMDPNVATSDITQEIGGEPNRMTKAPLPTDPAIAALMRALPEVLPLLPMLGGKGEARPLGDVRRNERGEIEATSEEPAVVRGEAPRIEPTVNPKALEANIKLAPKPEFKPVDVNEPSVPGPEFKPVDLNQPTPDRVGRIEPILKEPDTTIAYHGTPHTFDDFSLDYIGTGEGAQAYGHGLYFAEKKGIAENYKKQLSPGQVTYEGKPVTEDAAAQIGRNVLSYKQQGLDASSSTALAGALRKEAGKLAQDLVGETNVFTRSYLENLIDQYHEHANSLDRHPELDASKFAQGGNLYHVEIDAKPEQMLHWDVDMAKQPQAVQDALAKLPIKPSPSERGSAFYKRLSNELGSDAAASKALADAGIPGLRYLDHSSRAEGEGTHNIVLFDDSAVRVLKRNEEPVKPPKIVEEVKKGERPEPKVTVPDALPEPYTGIVEFGAGPFWPKKSVNKALDSVFGKPGEYRDMFNPVRDDMQLGVSRWNRTVGRLGRELRAAVPDAARRTEMTNALVRDDLASLPAHERVVAEKVRDFYREAGQQLLDIGKIDQLHENYSPDIWDLRDKQTKEIINDWQRQQGRPTVDPDSLLGRILGQAGVGRSMHTASRAIENHFAGMALGLKPKTLDMAALVETYGKNIGQTIERTKAIAALRNLRAPDGTPLAMQAGEDVPRNYARINDPSLDNLRVHPDIAPAVRALLQRDIDPSVFGRTLQLLSFMAKRLNTGYSGFHPMSLYKAWQGTLNSAPGKLAPTTGALKAVFGDIDTAVGGALKGVELLTGNKLEIAYKTAARKAIEKGLDALYSEDPAMKARVDGLVKEGLVIEVPLEDVMGRDVYHRLLETGADILAKAHVGLDNVPKAMLKVDKAFQHYIWNYVHTGLKAETALRLQEFAMERELSKPAGERMAQDLIDRNVAQQVNATFGGLNWPRLVEAFDRPIAQRMVSQAVNATGKRWLQVLTFAPDWLISTVASWSNMLAEGGANATRRQLARRYVGLSAVAAVVVTNAVQMALTGHTTLDNVPRKKNPELGDTLKAMTEVHLPDGRTMQINKHFMEVPHAMMHPGQFALGKLGVLPNEAIAQIQGKEFASVHPTDRYPPAMESRALHALNRFRPFVAQPGGLGGSLGLPIYGQTNEQLAEQRAQNKQEGKQKRMDKRLDFEGRMQRRLDRAMER